MKVAVVNLTAGGISGGYRKYLLNILPRLAGHPSITDLVCASPMGWNLEHCFGSDTKIIFTRCRPYRFFSYNPGNEFLEFLKYFGPNILFIPVERFFYSGGYP